MGDHEHACLRNGTNHVSSSMGWHLCFSHVAESDCHDLRGAARPCIRAGCRRRWLRQSKCILVLGCLWYHMMPAVWWLTLNSAFSNRALTMCQPLSSGRSGIVSARGRAGGPPLRVRKGSRRTFEKASRNTEACGSS